MRRTLPAAITLAMALAACGGGGSKTTDDGQARCEPSGTALEITARGLQFDKDCLAAPAGQAFSIRLSNRDPSTAHNVWILFSKGGRSLFEGDEFNGVATKTYQVNALEAGTYYFYCQVHTTMDGTFVVK